MSRRITHYSAAAVCSIIAGAAAGGLWGFAGPMPSDPHWIAELALYAMPACPAFVALLNVLEGAGAFES